MNNIAELAAKAAARVDKAWVRGSLTVDEWDEAANEWVTDVENCAVCLLGGLAYAYFGDPERGYEEDGNGYDEFVKAVASVIARKPVDNADKAQSICFKYNDKSERKTTVVNLLKRVAAKHAEPAAVVTA